MKDAINERFKISVEYLISEKIAKSKSEIATAMGIKPNTFSEILNKRMSIGVQMIEPFCVKFGISVDWLVTGRGEMLRKDNTTITANSDENVSRLITILENTLKEKDSQINRLLSIIENKGLK